jgi:hypothetical protein
MSSVRVLFSFRFKSYMAALSNDEITHLLKA